MWDWEFAYSILPKLLKVVDVTIEATLSGFVLAALLGMLLAFGRRSKRKPIAWASGLVVEFIRSTPLLIQLYFLYFALPFYGISLPAFTVGVIGLGLHYSTYLSEVYRAGIENVPRGQWEAAIALNFSRSQTWMRIILPQAIRPVVPVLGNYLITMFKETPLLSTITVVELMQTAKMIGSQSFRYLEAFTIAGFLFLLLSYLSAIWVRRMELRLEQK
ncbi:ectoine/hydroxyectoine ABC transporter permease subunit EhuD [Effusibacillus dendaii]|uniref:Ectoine/hydroxyectoine ABC transporter permease subunit EhuD n=1 Tax=Effusibacillus dendaii TaxID=2743772 RepID=A0A7I8D993_9BACL|nr:ectoine/hydroxyectoine ABC transporter permease subunit EhuD [Effusibacillus dendaii]BCJ86708.1 ectoine/hydroxyectoine ABC transporter permease subunit EhuD [Effusibacillus dendaii]